MSKEYSAMQMEEFEKLSLNTVISDEGTLYMLVNKEITRKGIKAKVLYPPILKIHFQLYLSKTIDEDIEHNYRARFI